MKSQENQAIVSIERLSIFDMDGSELTVCPLTAAQSNSIKTVTIPLPYGDNFSWLLL